MSGGDGFLLFVVVVVLLEAVSYGIVYIVYRLILVQYVLYIV